MVAPKSAKQIRHARVIISAEMRVPNALRLHAEISCVANASAVISILAIHEIALIHPVNRAPDRSGSEQKRSLDKVAPPHRQAANPVDWGIRRVSQTGNAPETRRSWEPEGRGLQRPIPVKHKRANGSHFGVGFSNRDSVDNISLKHCVVIEKKKIFP